MNDSRCKSRGWVCRSGTYGRKKFRDLCFFIRIDLRHKLAEVCIKECITILYDRVGTEIFAFAIFAVTPYPYIVKLIHRLLNDLWLVSQYAGLEVASRVCLHADAGTSEVCAADIHLFTVEHQHLEMNTRTENSFQAVV